MENLLVRFDKECPQPKGIDVSITADIDTKKNYLYKFMIGYEGKWFILRNFSHEKKCIWRPEKDGRYIIMIQAKEEGSKKPFDAHGKGNYIVGQFEESLIKNIYLNKREVTIGEKINLEVETSRTPVMFRYWISGKTGWEIIKDYSTINTLQITPNESGKKEILIECKNPNSPNAFDDYRAVKINVIENDKVEIRDFKSLNDEMVQDEELSFKVEAKYNPERTILYKFIRISQDGKAVCIQDFSSRTMVSYTEHESGKFKLLCLARDIYSSSEFDDRAILHYEVIPYEKIIINSFTSDYSSPQPIGRKVVFKALAAGGKNLKYRYKIEGNYGEDSGYINSNYYEWETKYEGEYKITLFVKDDGYEGAYEDKTEIKFLVDKKVGKSVRINNVLYKEEKYYLINKTINIKTIAEGEDVRYSFLVYKDDKKIEEVGYGSVNWVDFTPTKVGTYHLEIRVKDKSSPREYDAHTVIYFNITDYIPGEIDYVLFPAREYYVVGDELELQAVMQHTQENMVKFIIKIDGHIVEDSGFINEKKLKIIPKRSGKYSFEIYSRNKRCKEEFDCKKEMHIYVQEASPVINTKLQSDTINFKKNREITFAVSSQGGKDVCYEFYLMEKGNWNKVQGYSRKNYYGFVPYTKGKFKILVLARSYYKKCAYEDYDEITFIVD